MPNDCSHKCHSILLFVQLTLQFWIGFPQSIIDVVVQFYIWFKFYFPSFLGMVMSDNEFETKENKT